MADPISGDDMADAASSLAESLEDLRDSLVLLSLFFKETQFLVDSEERARAIEQASSLLESLRRRGFSVDGVSRKPH